LVGFKQKIVVGMSRILIVGAGFSGAVVARELAEAGFSVDVIDKRDHIGGNAFDFVNEHGIRIHKYGPHLFHTSNEKVFRYLSRFTEWIPYRHRVKAMLSDGRLVTLPVNRITKEIVGAENVVDTFIRPYSEKMWALPLEKISPDIINRVPVRDDENEDYFPDDTYQFMPKDGYTTMFDKILSHPNINLQLNTLFEQSKEADYYHVFNSMPIDEYYEFQFGPLPYRSIKFYNVDFPAPKLFPVSVVNFTHRGPITRVVEWKNIPGHGDTDTITSLTYEEPCDYKENNNERYYPVKDNDGINRAIYNQYRAIDNPKVTFIGRLGQYVYLDMHQCVNAALVVAEQFKQKQNK
jgi:UDP-galactopyranose mutase